MISVMVIHVGTGECQMSEFRKQLADRLESARQRVSELKRQLESLQGECAAAEREVTTWEGALLAEQRASGGISTDATDMLERPLRGFTLGDAVRQILQRVEGPLHVKDILRSLRSQAYPITSKNPIPAIVTTLTRRKDFKRVAPNTFDLAERGGEEESRIS